MHSGKIGVRFENPPKGLELEDSIRNMSLCFNNSFIIGGAVRARAISVGRAPFLDKVEVMR